MSIPAIEDDGSLLRALDGRTVAILGYGNQGEAHALNLRDSGVTVIVGARAGGGAEARAVAAGFRTISIPDASADADLAIVALPDEVHGEVVRDVIAPHLRHGAVLGFLHGFSIRFGRVVPPAGAGVVMVAPKGPGTTLRDRFVRGLGIPCLFAVHQETDGSAERLGLAWASGIGCGRARILRSTFADEAETDLFGEQAVLCGGMSALVQAAFEILVEAGYPPELAYIECCHEVKQVADLVYERGLDGMRRAISTTAEFGAYAAGPRVVDASVRARLREMLTEIRDGAFARTMADDQARGFPWLTGQRRASAAHPIEEPSALVRSWMSPKAPTNDHDEAGREPHVPT